MDAPQDELGAASWKTAIHEQTNSAWRSTGDVGFGPLPARCLQYVLLTRRPNSRKFEGSTVSGEIGKRRRWCCIWEASIWLNLDKYATRRAFTKRLPLATSHVFTGISKCSVHLTGDIYHGFMGVGLEQGLRWPASMASTSNPDAMYASLSLFQVGELYVTDWRSSSVVYTQFPCTFALQFVYF
jgi:hypothetical protein